MTRESGAVAVTGPRCARLATTLLQRIRLARPAGGIWEAADVQWWSRQEQPAGRDGQLFWLDDRGEPVAAVIRTQWGAHVVCDVHVLPDDPGLEREVWQAALGRAGELGVAAEFPVRADQRTGIAELLAAGYRCSAEPPILASWLGAADRPAIPPLAPGYRLLSRAQTDGRPHPMIRRNGAQVAERLSRCSLYRPELDLVAEAPDGSVAGYGLFWADLVTGVGLVEPMRTEDAHQRRGIASHLLATGLDLLAAAGCQRLKVANDIPLYLRAGFQPDPAATAAIYLRTESR